MNGISFTLPSTTTIHSSHLVQPSPVSEESLEMRLSSLKPVEQLYSPASGRDITRASDDHAAQTQTPTEREAAQKEMQQEAIDQQIVKKLSTLDREVRNHELAHAIVGGKYTGTPHYQYERGPDGINYAVAGEVSISVSAIKDNPELTIEKAQIIRRAALAPAEPSTQDRRVAMEALQMEADAHLELLTIEQERRAELLAEQSAKKQDFTEEAVMPSQDSHVSSQSIDHFLHAGDLKDGDAMDMINQAQEDIFNVINQELATQLVALGGAQQAPRSLGSIINRLA